MDQLNKQQIVLLTLLVSIVTSITTGITTISLIGQNPVQTVNQTVNRVVEKTIERVIEKEKVDDGDVEEKPIEKEIVTVVVNEEDLTIEAIENNSKSIVRIFESKSGDFVSMGVIIKKDGTLYTPGIFYKNNSDYIGEFNSGSFALNLVEADDENNITILKPNIEDEEVEFLPISVGDSDELRLGQSVISISGINNNVVSTGIVTSMEKGINDDSERYTSLINTSVKSDIIQKGSILLNLNGKIVGMKMGLENLNTTFYPINIINYNI